MAGSSWSDARTIAGFLRAAPNARLMEVATAALRPSSRLLDIGCGAGRNAVPLALAGWRVVGADLSAAMLTAAAERLTTEALGGDVDLVLAPMTPLPFASGTFDFVVAYGVWNLARSDREFTEAVKEAARVARPGALLFVFTFSRHTLPAGAAPVAGESLVFTQFSGERQCFVSEDRLQRVLAEAGFIPGSPDTLRELNRSPEGVRTGNTPVIYEGVFRRSAD